MSRFVALVAVIAFCFSLGFAADAAVAPKTFGKTVTIKEATAIASVNAEPTKYADKVILVTGKVANVCQGTGCWVEVEAADGAKILCKSMDESVHFPKDCAGSMVTVQGKVVYDAKATGTPAECKMHKKGEAKAAKAHKATKEAKTEAKVEAKEAKAEVKDAKAETKEAEHACPTAKVMVSIEGAELVQLAAAPAAAPATDAKAEVKEAPKTDVKEAPKAEEKKVEDKKDVKKDDGKK